MLETRADGRKVATEEVNPAAVVAPMRPHLIKLVDGKPQVLPFDGWRMLADGETWQASERVLLPLAVALKQADALQGQGVWLAPSDDPVQAVPLFARTALIAVQFPSFTDGRGYSTAALLRTRLGYKGELRAIGDVLRDQLFYLRRVGFDSFALRGDRDPHDAVKAFADFSDAYQGSTDQPLPSFRRVAA